MQKKISSKPAILALAAVTVLLLALVGATYAWFTHNSYVKTNRISSKASDADVKLILSLSDSPFDGVSELDLNAAALPGSGLDSLMPVSTSDLKTFVYNSGLRVSGETDIFHARIYLRAEGDEALGQKLAVYLDDTADKPLFTNDPGSLFLNAGRLGLLFEDKEPVMIALSDDSNSADKQVDNTKLNGASVARGQVLHMDSAGIVSAVPDPAVSVSKLGIKDNSEAKPLVVLDMNKTCRLDIYFYLEGTDPDCSGALELSKASVHIAFYGELTDSEE